MGVVVMLYSQCVAFAHAHVALLRGDSALLFACIRMRDIFTLHGQQAMLGVVVVRNLFAGRF